MDNRKQVESIDFTRTRIHERRSVPIDFGAKENTHAFEVEQDLRETETRLNNSLDKLGEMVSRGSCKVNCQRRYVRGKQGPD